MDHARQAPGLGYRLHTNIGINTYDLEPGSFYLLLAAEWFADLGGTSSELFADELRSSLGLGYASSPSWTLDLRYHRQRSREAAADDFHTNSQVIDFSARTSVRIRDLIKGQ